MAYDCTGLGAEILAGGLSSEGGRYVSIIPVDKDLVARVNPAVEPPKTTLMYSIFNEPFDRGSYVGNQLAEGTYTEAKPDEWEFAKKWWEMTRGLFAEGKMKTVKPVVNHGEPGLKGVLIGLEELKAERISAGKFVYTI
jgi:hypothetical protein